MNKKLSLEAYKGTRDFYPEDQFVQSYIFEVWRKTAESFGYVEYNASILEETELYKAKSGEEIVNEQTYSFVDRGGREVTIRPEMTPTVARLVAQKRKELVFPLRWFSIPNLFRYERPQRGRLREHWQLNVDMFGIDSIEADAEIISVAYNIMKEFGAKNEDFEIRINSRKAKLKGLKEKELSEELNYKIVKLLDKKNKLPSDEFKKQTEELLGETLELSYEETEETKEVINRLKDRGINNVRFDNTLVRGFDYYTGIVFEIYDTSPLNNRALFGGGRYDDLVGIFDVEKVSGVGFGMGDVTIRDFLETHGLLPQYQSPIDLYVAHMEEKYLEYAEKLASELRTQGLNVAVDLTYKKISNQVKTADRQKAKYLIVIGEEEAKTNQFKLKNMATGDEKFAGRKEIVTFIKK